jgi:hypothetical protein
LLVLGLGAAVVLGLLGLLEVLGGLIGGLGGLGGLIGRLIGVLGVLGLVGVLEFVVVVVLGVDEELSNPLRGGAWNTPVEQATSFCREEYTKKHTKFCGFRCARDIPPIV